METVEIARDLFFVQRGYLSGNHFAYRSERPILIDTGYLGRARETEAHLADLGIELDKVSHILNTHTHCDHIGINNRIQQRSGCEIWLHRVGKHFIDSLDDWSTWSRYYGQEAEFFDATLGLVDGDRIEVGPHTLEVLHLPGHSADGLAYYIEKEKVLLSGDTLWGNGVPGFTVRVEGNRTLIDTMDSLEKLAGLKVERVFPGHGPVFTDYSEAVERSKKRIARYIDDPQAVGTDLFKRIIVYTLLMHDGAGEDRFFDELMGTIWFPENVEYYADGDYDAVYRETMAELEKLGAVARVDGRWVATVDP